MARVPSLGAVILVVSKRLRITAIIKRSRRDVRASRYCHRRDASRQPARTPRLLTNTRAIHTHTHTRTHARTRAHTHSRTRAPSMGDVRD